MKKYLIPTIMCSIIAAFFYAAIWTNEDNNVSKCFELSGYIAIFHMAFSCLGVYILKTDKN